MAKSGCRGFTLVELMIVIGILGVLSSIALVQYKDYVLRSAENSCLSEAKAYSSVLAEARYRGAGDPVPIASACSSISVEGTFVVGTPSLPGKVSQRIDIRVP